MLNLSEPRWLQSDVCKLTKLKPATLQTWANRRIIMVSNPGRAAARLYSPMDILILVVIRDLTAVGITVSAAVDFAARVVEPRAAEVRAQIIGERALPEGERYRAILSRVDGSIICDVFKNEHYLLLSQLRPQANVHVIVDVDELLFEVLHNLWFWEIEDAEREEELANSRGNRDNA